MFSTIPFHVLEQAILPFFDLHRLRAFSRTNRFNQEAVKSYLQREYGIDEERTHFLESVKKNGKTNVGKHIKENRVRVIQFLMRREGMTMNTPRLHQAARCGSDEICSFLVDQGLFRDMPRPTQKEIMNDVAGKCSVSTMKKLLSVLEPSQSHVISAAKANNLEMVQLLVQCKGESPPRAAQFAISNSSYEMFRFLLLYHDAVNRDTVEAAANHSEKMFSILFEVVTHDYQRGNILAHAARCGYSDIVLKMFEQEFTGRPKDWINAFKYACKSGSLEIARLLLPSVNVNECKSCVREVCKNGYEEILDFLFSSGLSMKSCDSDGEFALKYAAENGHVEIVQRLLKHGLNPDRDGSEALALACLNGHLEIARLLLSAGAKTNANKCSPLTRAARSGHNEIISLLLENGPDVNTKQGDPMKEAVRNKHTNTVLLLLKRGSRMNAFEVAVGEGRYEMAKFLAKRGERPKKTMAHDPVDRTVRHGDYEITNIILHDVEYNSEAFHRMLAYAIEQGYDQIAELLLQKATQNRDFSLDDCEKEAKNAVSTDNRKAVQLLLRYGMKPSVATRYIDEAAKRSCYDVARFLLDTGQCTEKNRIKSCIAAIEAGDKEIFELLMQHGGDLGDYQDAAFEAAVSRDYIEIARRLLHLTQGNFVTLCGHSGSRRHSGSKIDYITQGNEVTPCGHNGSSIEYVTSPRRGDAGMRSSRPHVSRSSIGEAFSFTGIFDASDSGFHPLSAQISDLCGHRRSKASPYVTSPLREDAGMGSSRPHVTGSCSESILRTALEHASYNCIKLLLDNISCSSERLNRALDQAVESGRYQAANLLLGYGAQPNCINICTPCAGHGNHELLKTLLQRFSVPKSVKNAAMSRAIDRGNCRAAKVLLEHGGEISIESLKNLDRDNFEIGEMCLRCNARVRNREGLKVATVTGSEELLKGLLRRKGANVHTNNEQALRLASWHGYENIVRLLLQMGADVHAKQEEALIKASARGHLNVVKCLLEHGAKVRAKNYEALRTATKSGFKDIVSVLLESTTVPIKIKTELIAHAAWCHNKEILNLVQQYL